MNQWKHACILGSTLPPQPISGRPSFRFSEGLVPRLGNNESGGTRSSQVWRVWNQAYKIIQISSVARNHECSPIRLQNNCITSCSLNWGMRVLLCILICSWTLSTFLSDKSVYRFDTRPSPCTHARVWLQTGYILLGPGNYLAPQWIV